MKTILKSLLCLLFLAILFSCAQEEIGGELMISGKFAQINESGLTKIIVEFKEGHFTRWESDESYPFAEKRIWHCASQDFRKTATSPYSIIDGVLFSGYANLGNIELADDVLHFNGDTFGVMEGFIPSAYSRITVNPEEIIDLTYAAESVRVPVHIENPIPAGVVSATTSAKWISNLRVEDGYLLFNTASTKENRDAVITLSYTHADDLNLTVIQAPSTFIRFAEPDKTIGYEASSQSIEYTIDNSITSSVLTISCYQNWIQNLEIQDGRVNFNVTENNTGNERKAYFYFQYEGAPDAMYTLTQKWDAATIITSPTSAEFEYTGGQGNFTFEIQNPRQGTTVTAQSQVNWISNVLVNGNTVTYRVAENNSGAQRTGILILQYGNYATLYLSTTQKGKPVVSLNLNKNSLTLIPGKNETLVVTVNPADAPLKWTSNNLSVATVSQVGEVIAFSIGVATICVSADNGITANCEVVVGQPVTGIALDKTSLDLEIGDTWPLSAFVSPSEAINKGISWSIDNSSVATVSNNGLVTALSKGKATIIAMAKDGSGITVKCEVVVSNPGPTEAVYLGTHTSDGYRLYWAKSNLSSNGLCSKPEEYGDYYAWGETAPKDVFYWLSYKWCNGSDRFSIKKYNTRSSYGTVDNKTQLEPEDDAAHITLGGSWRLPTDAEWTELVNNCICTWTNDYNGTGVAGRIVTSKVDGYTDNSIFLPGAGYRDDRLMNARRGHYWSSTLYTDFPDEGWGVYFTSTEFSRKYYLRCHGESVRPVSE